MQEFSLHCQIGHQISDDSDSKTNITFVVRVFDSKGFDHIMHAVMMSDIAGTRKRQTVAVTQWDFKLETSLKSPD